MTTVEVFAPAKINLTLHITGQRSDGYHELDSLVAFAPVGDTLSLTDYAVSSLTVEGPEAAGVPADTNNLVLKALSFARRHRETSVTLTKNLPKASGIGGGSTDAAAAIRGALALQNEAESTFLAFGPDILIDTRFRGLGALGADIPMCLWPNTLRARGIGEKITFHPLPPLPAVLVNPRVPVSTPNVFRALTRRDNAPMPEPLPTFSGAADAIDWLTTQRNDLQSPAIDTAPVIGTVLETLANSDGCALARMSGSGATCFGLFPDEDAAKSAAAALGKEHPTWWVAGGVLGNQTQRAMPLSR